MEMRSRRHFTTRNTVWSVAAHQWLITKYPTWKSFLTSVQEVDADTSCQTESGEGGVGKVE